MCLSVLSSQRARFGDHRRLTSEIQDDALRSVTLAFDEFDGTQFDEAALAEKIAAHYDTAHNTQRVKGTDFRDEYDRLRAAMDQPSIDGVNTYFVSKVTAETGLKVAMSGLGGDELFGGYPELSRDTEDDKPVGRTPGMRGAGTLLRKLGRRSSAPLHRPNMPAFSNMAPRTRMLICCAARYSCRGNCPS